MPWKVTLTPDPAYPELQLEHWFKSYDLVEESFRVTFCKVGGVKYEMARPGLMEVFDITGAKVAEIISAEPKIVILDQATHF